MKSTGIVRRIDELGRVVIPKEIRRTMRIHEGDPLEIFTQGGTDVILRKYSNIGAMDVEARALTETLYKTIGATALICDKDTVVYCSGNGHREFEGKKISGAVEELIEERTTFTACARTQNPPIEIVKNENRKYASQILVPIISGGETIGAVIMLSDNDLTGDAERKIAQFAAMYLGRHAE